MVDPAALVGGEVSPSPLALVATTLSSSLRVTMRPPLLADARTPRRAPGSPRLRPRGAAISERLLAEHEDGLSSMKWIAYHRACPPPPAARAKPPTSFFAINAHGTRRRDCRCPPPGPSTSGASSEDAHARHKAGHDDTLGGSWSRYGIFFTGLVSSPNSRAALPPRMLRLACSLRNGRS